jgi:hypothetical protein
MLCHSGAAFDSDDHAVIPCCVRARWVEPDVVCRMSSTERMENGGLRAAVIENVYRETNPNQFRTRAG